MKTELGYVREQHVALSLPVREKLEGRVPLEELVSRRRLVRVETDGFLKDGLWADDLVEIAIRIGRLAFVTAGTLAQFGQEPTIVEFAKAVQELIEDARTQLDKALQVQDWPGVKVSAAKLEVIWYGLASSIGMPYFDLLKMMHDQYVKGEAIDRTSVQALLYRAGLPVENPQPQAANEEQPQP